MRPSNGSTITRAPATTHAATLEILDDLGLAGDVMARGLIEPKFRVWDRAAREVIVEFDFGVLKHDTRYPFVVQCEQHKLATMAIERLAPACSCLREFSSRVVNFEQFDDRVEAEVETPSGHPPRRRRLSDRLRRRPLDGAQNARHRV